MKDEKEMGQQELRAARRRVEKLEELELELRAEVASLRGFVLSIVALVPPERLGEIKRELPHPQPETSASPEEMFTGWVESTALTPSDVATELKLLWQRCGRRS